MAITKVVGETPAGAVPGTSFTLAHPPVLASEALYLNGLRLQRVGATPNANQYLITVATITTGKTVDTNDQFQADYLW